MTWRTTRIQKRGEYGEVESRIVPLCNPLAVQSGSLSLSSCLFVVVLFPGFCFW